MTKVQVTKDEYAYLETFGGVKNKALYYISRFGWGFDLENGQEKTHNDKGKKWTEILDNGDFSNLKQKLIRAVLDGYELKEEKLYNVEIPDPYGAYDYTFLKKNKYSQVFIEYDDTKEWKHWDMCQLTEKEIKQDFDWAWQWAKPVEEE